MDDGFSDLLRGIPGDPETDFVFSAQSAAAFVKRGWRKTVAGMTVACLPDVPGQISVCELQPAADGCVYAVSFNFTGCSMALFRYNKTYYAAHIYVSNGESGDRKSAWNKFFDDNGIDDCILFVPNALCEEIQAGIQYLGVIEFHDFANFECFSVKYNRENKITGRGGLVPRTGSDCKFPKNGAENFDKALFRLPEGGCCIVQ